MVDKSSSQKRGVVVPVGNDEDQNTDRLPAIKQNSSSHRGDDIQKLIEEVYTDEPPKVKRQATIDLDLMQSLALNDNAN